jgi:methionyl-tRNA formyltransferase
MVREPLLRDFLLLNVHGSLLPEYRGAAPIERAIMDGRTETGVGIMRMEAGLDTGPVAIEARVPIHVGDDAGSVFAKLEAAGGLILFDALERADAGTLEFTPQPIDGQRLGLWCTVVAGDDCEVAGRAGVVRHDQERMFIGCAQGALEVLELQPPGKRRMAAGDWLRGLRMPLREAHLPELPA